VVELVPAPGASEEGVRAALGEVAASASARNVTLQAIADAYEAKPRPMLGEVPFSSRRRWSAVSFAEGSFYLGAPGRVPVGSLAAVAEQRQRDGRRVLALARGQGQLPADAGEQPPEGLEPLGLVVLAEELRPNVRDTIEFLRAEGVEVKVLSGDAAQTVAAIARDVGIPVSGVREGSEIPDAPQARRSFALEATVVGRISPEGKQAVVEALREAGRYVAMMSTMCRR
jgi:cation-transporting ATPase E